MDVNQLASKLPKVRAWELKHVRVSELHKMAVDLASLPQTDVDRLKVDLRVPSGLTLWQWVESGASVRSGANASTQSA